MTDRPLNEGGCDTGADRRPQVPAGAEDETLVTDITIGPDGRVFVFGTSRPVLEVLEALNPADPRLRRLLEQVRAIPPVRAIGPQSRSDHCGGSP
jgi:hypothetical protein